ncbi:MAG TPA: hypothetical protein VL993_09160 [Stellaceae bacterium]|nr:hypothetical protein [Stellaceae bacterium]
MVGDVSLGSDVKLTHPKELAMHRIMFAAAALAIAAAPAAFAQDASGMPANSSAMPADSGSAAAVQPADNGTHAKMHRVIHYRHSSAAPLAADERSVADAREHRQTRAMNLIGAAGYNDFSNLTRDGKNFRATAMKGQQSVSVLVNPDTGSVTPE